MSTTFATSIGQSADSLTLGRTLATQTASKLGPRAPDLAVVFASSTQNYAQLLQGFRHALGNHVPMIGCSTAGEFTEEQISNNGAACALIASDTLRFSIGLGKHLRANPERAFQQAIANLQLTLLPDYPHRLALLLIDGLTGRGDDVMAAAHKCFGSDIYVAGGAAGNNLLFNMTHVFHNDSVYPDALLCCLIHSKAPLRTIVTHGHFPFGNVMKVTKAEKNRVFLIDGKNAWEVWKDATRVRRKELGFTDDTLANPSSLNQFFPHFALGIIEHEKTYKMRSILTKQPDGALDFAGQVPEGSDFRVMYSDQASQFISMERAAKFAKVRTKQTAGALMFDCYARSAVLGDEFYRSIQVFNQTFGSMPFLGFETYGEMCSDALHFHGFLNGTCVVLLIPD